MLNKVRYVNALKYLEESDIGQIANCNSNPIEMVEELEALGCAVKVELAKDFDGEERFTDALFVTLPKKITPEHITCIASLRPDEISEEKSGQLRLWWD
ncbi:MAG TPA: hypothetical protein VM577_18825 [Anaerovoracaceae bacterium]|nr:hypothetical protein [Anaerovoracaceae bacterium]